MTDKFKQVLDPVGGYFVMGERLEVGDHIELWTSYGWESDRFAWLGELHLPFLDQCPAGTPFEAGQHDCFIITDGMLCRRLQPVPSEAVSQIELRQAS